MWNHYTEWHPQFWMAEHAALHMPSPHMQCAVRCGGTYETGGIAAAAPAVYMWNGRKAMWHSPLVFCVGRRLVRWNYILSWAGEELPRDHCDRRRRKNIAWVLGYSPIPLGSRSKPKIIVNHIRWHWSHGASWNKSLVPWYLTHKRTKTKQILSGIRFRCWCLSSSH